MDDLSRIPKGKEELWSIRGLPRAQEVLPFLPHLCSPLPSPCSPGSDEVLSQGNGDR